MARRKITSLKQLLARFIRKDSGVAAIEFAMIGAPFLWLLLVVFETAGVIFTDIALQNGVIETGRLIRTGQVQIQGMGAAQFKTLLCANTAPYINCSQIRVDVTKSASLPLPAVNMMTVADTVPQNYQPGAASEWVMVQVRYDWKLAVPGITYLANMPNGMRRLTAGTMFRNEPFSG
jgi:Flp pilus assembly protein TadG